MFWGLVLTQWLFEKNQITKERLSPQETKEEQFYGCCGKAASYDKFSVLFTMNAEVKVVKNKIFENFELDNT